MRAFKLALISAVILFIIGTLMGLLLPSQVIVSRATDIAAPREAISSQVMQLSNWKSWIAGADTSGEVKMLDAKALQLARTIVTVYEATDTSLVTQWKSKSSLMIGSFNIISHSRNLHTLHWQMVQHVGWLPWERLGTMMNDKILGPSMEQGLDNIKKKAEGSTAE